MVDAGDDLDVSGLGKVGERRCDVPGAGALDEGGRGPKMRPPPGEVAFEVIAEPFGRRGLVDEFHDRNFEAEATIPLIAAFLKDQVC